MELNKLISMSLRGPSVTAEGSSLPATKNEPAVFRESDFVLLIDEKDKGWVVKIADIALLEACGNYTRFHFAKGTALIRRSLTDCESRLDSSAFFRATRDRIVNLSHVKQTRGLGRACLSFVLRRGKEVLLSRKQSRIFRKTRLF
jgi:two-component system LytT family response regulator